MSSHIPVSSEEPKLPRAVIHKKILDAARAQPGASVTELANAVNGATTGLVERVLEEYGDPAATGEGQGGDAEQSASNGTVTPSETEQTTGGKASASNGSTVSDPERNESEEGDTNLDESNEGVPTPAENETAASDAKSGPTASMSKTEPQHVTDMESRPVELTEKQRLVLRAIRESPDATQSELADRFDVTQSTINNRLNSIKGFDWKHRRTFINQMFDESDPGEDGQLGSAAIQNLSNQLDDLSAQVSTLERRLEDSAESQTTPFGDPDLACTVVRACINSEDVSTEEENRILRAVITGETPPE